MRVELRFQIVYFGQSAYDLIMLTFLWSTKSSATKSITFSNLFRYDHIWMCITWDYSPDPCGSANFCSSRVFSSDKDGR